MISIEDKCELYFTLISRYAYVAAITERILTFGRALFRNQYVLTFEKRCKDLYNSMSLRNIIQLLCDGENHRLVRELAYEYADMIGFVALLIAFYVGIKYFLFKTILICVTGLSLYIYVKIMEGREIAAALSSREEKKTL